MHSHVYLSGPISGLTFDESECWRQQTNKQLAAMAETMGGKITCLIPLRHQEADMRALGVIDQAPSINAMSADRGIINLNYLDTQRCDLVLVNLLGAKRVSIGTMMEVAWAYTMHKPIVVVMEDEGNLHENPLLRGSYGWRINNLPEALAITCKILMP